MILCKYCSEESMELNLCESCNMDMGYYPKSDEAPINGFINCYNNPEEYYFDNSISKYKPCYHSCERCDGLGTIENHRCYSCNSRNTHSFKMYENSEFINCYQN